MKNNARLIWLLAAGIVLFGFLYLKFCHSNFVLPPPPEPTVLYKIAQSPIGDLQVPYRADQILLDPKIANSVDRANLTTKGFAKTRACLCGYGGYELWEHTGPGVGDAIGIIRNPPSGGAVGGLSLNFLMTDLMPVAVNVSDAQPIDPQDFSPNSPKPCKSPVVVAIVDSGADLVPSSTLRIPALAWNAYVQGPFCITPPPVFGLNMAPVAPETNEPTDGNGHGTHVNGIVTGVSRPKGGDRLGANFQFLNIKIMHGTSDQCDLFEALCGLEHALSQKADVINCSWGFYDDEKPLFMERFFQRARDSNVVIVAGLGNRGFNLSASPTRFWPAGFSATCDNVISVGAHDGTGAALWSHSNWSVDPAVMTVAAPGSNVLSAYPRALSPTGMAIMSGTSMAAPFITRSVAVLIAAQRCCRPPSEKFPAFKIRDFIYEHAVSPTPAPSWRAHSMNAVNGSCL